MDNSCYFRKIYFLQVTSLDPKFYKLVFFWDVNSTPNYIEKLNLTGIVIITLWYYGALLQVYEMFAG